MLYDILRFHACARRLVLKSSCGSNGIGGEISIGTYLERERYSDAFRDNYLIVSHSFHTSTRVPIAFLSMLAHDGSHLEYATGQVRIGFSCSDSSKHLET